MTPQTVLYYSTILTMRSSNINCIVGSGIKACALHKLGCESNKLWFLLNFAAYQTGIQIKGKREESFEIR